MSDVLGFVRSVYDIVNRLFEPVYRLSGILAGLAFVGMVVVLPSVVEFLGAFDVPVVPAGNRVLVVVFVVLAGLFVFFVAIETVTGLVANSTAFVRWVIDLVREE